MSEAIKNKLLETDLYKLFDVEDESSIDLIKKAYRKKALELHPDKNPNNKEEAEKKFVELGKAFEILADKTARAAYDAVRRQKREKAKRDAMLDEKRRKLKEDLEKREAAAKENFEKKVDVLKKSKEEEWLQKEVDRLRKEGSKLLEEEMNFINQQIRMEKKRSKENEVKYPKENVQGPVPRIKITLPNSSKESDKIKFNQSLLEHLFSKYGQIEVLVMSKKSAILEYKDKDAVLRCYNDESDLEKSYGLCIKILGDLEKNASQQNLEERDNVHLDTFSNSDSAKSFEDMEMEILKNEIFSCPSLTIKLSQLENIRIKIQHTKVLNTYKVLDFGSNRSKRALKSNEYWNF
ncbi:dnaJ -like protein [Brachionus plicatilis]|uniref:DnaJ-like protein n=1 Tax=Brachionus plicatilis TaxID=10195 RepID=A0A3M7PH38_BRAPC|nr:dnaJ -like protein [Brachionus plicatilis]